MIIVVRHGETAANAARVLQTPEVPLNEVGLRQAALLAEHLRSQRIGGVISSDLERARMTAQAITRALGVDAVFEPLLQERNFGALRGQPYAGVGGALFSPDFAPPAGEHVAAFDARVARAWERIVAHARTMCDDLVVVTHGLVCDSIARQFLRLVEPLALPARWGNTSVTICEPCAPHVVHVLNSVAHLAIPDAADGDAPSGL